MPHDAHLIPTLAGGLFFALLLGYGTQRLGLSPIVGYLLAGVVVGPNTPGFVADRKVAEQLAEVGVILLMFGVGLHFHFKDLLAVRRVAVPGALLDSLIATSLGATVALLLGWDWTPALIYGLTLSVASTVVLTRVLADHNALHTPAGHIAVGWLVVEDLFTVVILVLLPAVFPTPAAAAAAGDQSLVLVLGLALAKIVALVAVVVLVGGRVIPWLLDCVAATQSRELFTLTVLVLALGIAVGSATVFGVSMALGAFLAGMVVGRSDFGLRAAAEALPMRDAFAVLFFVSVGMLFDPRVLLDAPVLVLATVAVLLIGKPLTALSIVLLLGYPVRVAVSVALALAQIGEFSFILAELGMKLKTGPDATPLLPPAAMNALVGAAIVTISLNPILYRAVTPLSAWLARRLGGRPEADPTPRETEDRGERYRAVVVGYGPVGRTVCRLLHENGITPTVIEMNMETVTRLKAEGQAAIYGDANHHATLEAAGVAHAGTLILSASGLPAAEEVIRMARAMNPKIRVLARAAYLRERTSLRAAGADRVITGEAEIAMSMTEAVLRGLGAIPEQIDRERERVRADLFGQAVPTETPSLMQTQEVSRDPEASIQPVVEPQPRD